MASAPSFHVSNEELIILADRLRNIDSSKFGSLLGFDQELVTRTVREAGDQWLYRLLTEWREHQPFDCDIRRCLTDMLRDDFPDESESLSNRLHEYGVYYIFTGCQKST